MDVMCLQRVPALVVPLHRTVADSPLTAVRESDFLEADFGGLHILQALNPLASAAVRVSSSDTFLTIRQLER